MKNAGWLFYRSYYHWLEKPGGERFLQHFADSGKLAKEKDILFKDESRALTDFDFENGLNEFFYPGAQHFELETTYPGLLIGSGYSHQTGAMGEFKLGFFFDHCTGLPVIPGSSVKGLLRSAFPNKGRRQKHSEAKEKFIKNRLGEIRPELASINIDQLENLLFEGQSESGNYLPMYEHDVYLDAYITGTNNEGKRIFGEDYITPHLEALKNPVPVRFLKILPGVRFQFNFILHDSNLAGMAISVADKEQLYRGILQQFGVGAKTNVGYGQFTTP